MVIYKRLEEVCYILDSQRIPITASERTKGIYPYYGANGIQDYVDDYIFDDELVLLAEDGGNFGSTGKPIAYRVSGKCWVNNHAHVLKAKNIIDTDYLCLALMFYNTDGLVNGATRQKLTQKAMRSMIIPVRSCEDQQRIKLIIQKVFSLIESHKKQIEKLDELIKSRFVEMFGDPVSNPMKWRRQQLNELTNKIGSGATPRGGRDSYCTNGISLIRSMNVHNGFFGYKDLAHISDEQATKLSNVTIQKKDVLLNITGASVARCCVVPDDILPARVNQHVCIIRCNDYVIPIFVCKAFTSDSFQKYLLEIAGSGATREAITKQQIESIPMIVPPLSLQNQFADFVTQVEKQKATVQKSIDKLETLKKSLMQEYFG